MNILPKKRWHVRTKENMARVRRDEAKAAEEESRRLSRALLAEQEDRVRRLKEKASDRYGPSVFDRSAGPSGSDEFVGPNPEAFQHVNLFANLEEEERKNLVTTGNTEYLAEKKKEKDEWESKMGIMKYLGEGSNELTKQTSWYDKPPDRSIYDPAPAKNASKIRPSIAKPALERLLPHPAPKTVKKEEKAPKKEKKAKKEKRKKHKRRSSASSSSSEDEKDRKRKKLEQLRAERLARERAEKIKVEQLLNPKAEPPKPPAEPTGYNSQFNPEFARQRQPKEKRY